MKKALFLLGLIGGAYLAWRWWNTTQDVQETGAIAADSQAKARSLIRMREQQAAVKARELGLIPRLAIRDGVAQNVTQDFSPSRVNFQVTKGVVTGVRIG